MATNKICLKDYLTCVDDKKLSKTRAKMNRKSHKNRHYGMDHSYTMSDAGVPVSEMHDGVIPGAFSDNVNSHLPTGTNGRDDMKKENRRHAPRKRSFEEFLDYMRRAEEEESSFPSSAKKSRDWDEDEFDFDEDDLDIDKFETDEEDEFNFDDFEDEFDFDDNEEDEFDFSEDEFETSDEIDDEIEDIADVTGRFVDFYRADRNASEEEEEGPGAAPIGPVVNTGSTSAPKIDRARIVFRQLINMPGMTRKDLIETFIRDLGVTESTAVSYYERLAKEAGLTGNNDEDVRMGGPSAGNNDLDYASSQYLPPEEPEIPQEEVDQQPPNQQGIIRHVDGAHLVYKRQMEDGSFEELWIYNIDDKLNDALKIRRAILAGTDIPRGHMRSQDGQQAYTLTTLGNAQLLHITGLPN